jgi:hypothetical protein
MCMGCRKVNCICTRVAVGTIVYVRGLQWAQLCMYAGCNKVNRLQGFLARVGPYRLTSTIVQVTSSGRTCGLQ